MVASTSAADLVNLTELLVMLRLVLCDVIAANKDITAVSPLLKKIMVLAEEATYIKDDKFCTDAAF